MTSKQSERTALLKAVGRRMKQARIEAGLVQEEMAMALDVRVRSVQRWEAGRNEPGVASIAAWAVTTGVSTGWIIAGDDQAVAAPASKAELERVAKQLAICSRSIDKLLGAGESPAA